MRIEECRRQGRVVFSYLAPVIMLSLTPCLTYAGKKGVSLNLFHGLKFEKDQLFTMVFFLIQLLVGANIHTGQSKSLLCFSRIMSWTGEKLAWFIFNITLKVQGFRVKCSDDREKTYYPSIQRGAGQGSEELGLFPTLQRCRSGSGAGVWFVGSDTHSAPK